MTTKVVLSIISTILFLLAAGMLAAAIALGWLYGTQRNADGFVTSSEVSIATNGYAITSTDIDLGSIPEEWVPANFVGTFQVHAESASGSPLFVGVGPSAEVDAYLAGVEHTEVTRFGNGARLSYTEHAGSDTPQPPSDLGIWTVSSEGSSAEKLDWEPESGDWTILVMNADAAPGLDLSTTVGFKTPWITVGIWVTSVLTILIAAVAVVLASLASRQPSKTGTSDTGAPQPAPLSG